MKNLKPLAEELIEELFQKTIMRLLGPEFVAKQFLFSVKNFDPKTTLGSLYIHALSQQTVNYKAADLDTINRINNVAKDYLDVLKDKIKKEVTTAIDTNYHEVDIKSRLFGVTQEQFLNT